MEREQQKRPDRSLLVLAVMITAGFFAQFVAGTTIADLEGRMMDRSRAERR